MGALAKDQIAVAESGALREALLMKVKIFVGNDIGTLERQINDWLQKERITQIHHVTHANNVGIGVPYGLVGRTKSRQITKRFRAASNSRGESMLAVWRVERGQQYNRLRKGRGQSVLEVEQISRPVT